MLSVFPTKISLDVMLLCIFTDVDDELDEEVEDDDVSEREEDSDHDTDIIDSASDTELVPLPTSLGSKQASLRKEQSLRSKGQCLLSVVTNSDRSEM